MAVQESVTLTHVADAPGDGALFARGRCLVGLALDAEVHDVVAANSAVVDNNVPGPESDGVPLRSVNTQPILPEPQVPPLTFLTSKRFLSPLSVLAPALATFVLGAGASAMSTSAMAAVEWRWGLRGDDGAVR